MFRVKQSFVFKSFVSVALLFGCANLVFFACTSAPDGGQASVPLKPSSDPDYGPIEEKWTRKAHVYESFQKRLDANAILFTDEMRRAFAARWQKLHGDKATSLDDLGQGKLGIVVSIFTPEYPYTKLDERKIWGLQLKWGEQVLTPTNIKHLSQKAQFEPYFSFVNFWSHEYLLMFDVSPADANTPTVIPTQVTLDMRSALAAVEFVWK